MVGKVGADSFGDALIASARAAGVNTDHVLRCGDASSSVGNITLEIDGEGNRSNRIIVVPGANMKITPEDVAFLREGIADYDMVMLQFEIPMEVNELVAGYARAKNVPVMVNPAPAAPIPDGLMACTTYLSPNEHEAAALTGLPIRVENGLHVEDVCAVATAMGERGVRKLLITLGGNGAAVSSGNEVVYVPSVPNVRVADPTAAGDSFVAAFCTGVCVGLSERQAIDFARNTAAMTVSRPGAQPSLPVLKDVIRFMEEHAEPGFPFDLLKVLQ